MTYEIALQSDDPLGSQQLWILGTPERDHVPAPVQIECDAPSIEQDDVVVQRSRGVSGVESGLHGRSGDAGD